ncbi:polysaccharide deacetylase family protein [Bacillus sp. REN16]|uniref:polysaccharide deacetylase family protein n=1 Tax=Bacillus sp. REN16 TaxID=2887296 RepID=UPI001E484228|nr:polysaccharide deacetylase family protein [Bacillus sp. REN16]MCC3358461.1 polysaccharide deacetylase family protein [Bacillus sp. REN16]
MSDTKKMGKGNIVKIIALFGFIVLLLFYSFFLLKSKFFLEADASEPIVEVVAPVETPEKNEPIDDDLKVDDQPKGTIDEEKPTEEEPAPTTETTVEPAPVTMNPATPEVDDEQEADEEQDGPKETPAPPSRAVYLTFDDGPHKVSKDILALLDQYDALATFFMLDNNIKHYPDAVKEMVSKGHSVGLHGVTHDKNKFYQSSNSVLGEMDQTQQTILELTGIETDLIRTPFGSSPYMTDAYKNAVDTAGYKMWDWNIDSRDWQFRDSRYVDSVIDQLNKLNRVNEPIVILLHERPETLEHLPKLLDYLKGQGYEFKALDSTMHPIQLF